MNEVEPEMLFSNISLWIS